MRREICQNILATIGNTPLVRLNSVARGLQATLLGKAEFMNPGGSVKDRIGMAIIEEAERRGDLRPGGTIVEATSGNTGVGLALAAAIKGYKCVFVMPDKMSDEKIRLLQSFGARVVITPTAVAPEDPRSYYSVSRKLADETPNAVYANQYHNPVNPQVHYRTTGPEIWAQTGGKIDALVVGMGTGGTISGTGKFLKEKNPAIQVIGADPVGSLYYEYFKTGRLGAAHTYKIEGIGEDFLPSTMNFEVVDDVIQVSDQESFLMARRLVKEEAFFVGGSSGTAVAAALRYAKDLPEGKVVVVVLPDSGSRYLSKFLNDDWMRQNRFLKSDLVEGTVQDILGAKRVNEVITVSSQERMMDVIRTMKKHNISQVPVVDKGDLVGMITEVDLLNHMVHEAPHQKDETIAALVSTEHMEVVGPRTSLEALAEIFARGHVAVVLDGREVTGIVAKIDLIDFLAARVK
ncbi:MAG TPA: cystathionine beta-synthase [Vicinamibacteria bacterium]|nr:cystathionine beta-synthase [Vicinamibacteria bacterium]